MATHAKDFARKAAVVLLIGGAIAGGFFAAPLLGALTLGAVFHGTAVAAMGAVIGGGMGLVGGGILGGLTGSLFKKKDGMSAPELTEAAVSRSRQKELMPAVERAQFQDLDASNHHQEMVNASRSPDLAAGQSL